jgi:UDP-N-acetyl-D-mannosaminuronic acid dehydrogenase
MMIAQLTAQIADRSAHIGVIGLGYVGLPVACMLAQNGLAVTGIDIDAERVATINQGMTPIGGEEPGIADLIAAVVEGGRLRASTDYGTLRSADVIVICVDTPVESDTRLPSYRALRSVLARLGGVLKPGALVIVESTIAPGTMQQVVIPALEASSGRRAGVDFYVGHCPERVTPGLLLHNLTHMSRSVGGQTPEVAAAMVALYSSYVTGDLDPTDLLTAEIVKTAENAYRDVQIAFANELALVCEALGANVYAVRALLNKSPGRNMLLPGAGVGGHCIPKDPWLLIANVRDAVQPQLIPAARAVNDRMPLHMVELIERGLARQGVALEGAKIAVLGYAFREDTDDDRDSPTMHMLAHLASRGAVAAVQDPYVPAYQVGVEAAAAGAHALVIMVAHSVYKALDLRALGGAMSARVLIDGRGVFTRHDAEAAGFTYLGVGNA